MLNVQLLGGIAFSIAGSVVRPEFGPAGRLLACYLLEFTGRIHRRERLAGLFWRDAEPARARAALNTALWRVRKLFDQASPGASRHLVTLGDDVILEPSTAILVDTHRLEAACRRAASAPAQPGFDPRMQEVAALDLYAGPFMDGHEADWIVQERERLHALFVGALFALMRAAALRRDYEHALDLGRRILALDALRERIQQDVMLLLVLNGQRGEAIRTYRRLADLLETELGIAPMPETKRLHDDIMTGAIFGRLQDHIDARFGDAHARTF